MTTAPTAKARIITLLQGWSDLASVDIQPKGPVRENGVQPEMLFLGHIRGDQEWAALGNRQRREIYTIDLFIRTWIEQAGAIELDMDTRCWAIFDATETALRSDPSLGGLLTGNIQLATFEQDTVPTTEPLGFRGWLNAGLRVETLLRLP